MSLLKSRWKQPAARCLLLAAALVSTSAQAIVTADDGFWTQFVAEGSLKAQDPSLEKVRLWTEAQSRWAQGGDHWYQGMARVALGYSLSDRATIWAGYTYLPTENLGRHFIGQQDVWPAFRYVLPTDYGTFTLRTMLESNFLIGNDVRFRSRNMLKYSAPFAFDRKLSLVLWDEGWARLNNTNSGGNAGFDQNRGFAGFGWEFDKALRTEVGYMNQYIADATQTNYTMQNLAMVSLFYSF